MTALLILATVFLAYANGANDNFKGVATLYGSGTTTYRRALAYATAAALLGSIAALFLGAKLVAAFGGKGLVPDSVAVSPTFASSVALAAASTVILATFLGLPVSTTHALTGALVGAGFVAVGREVSLEKLRDSFLLPLLLGPILAVVSTLLLYPVLRSLRRVLGVTESTCLCVGPARTLVPVPVGVAAAAGSRFAVTEELAKQPPVAVTVGEEALCLKQYGGSALGLPTQRVLDALHFLTAGVVCFARSLNDTPKLVGLLALSGAVRAEVGLLVAGAAVAVGGLVNSRKVAEMMSKKTAALNAGSGFTANLVTAVLVLAASIKGLPLSTTHVSVGGIFGIGVANRTAKLGVVAQILLAWVTTLPLGAALAAGLYAALR